MEEYVKDSALHALLNTVEDAARDLNVQTLENASADALTDACETLPFFAERRIVVCQTLSKDADWKRLSAYIPSLPDTTLLVFFVRGQASAASGLFKLLNPQGRAVEFDTLSERDSVKWLVQRAAQLGATLSPAAARYLVTLAGRDLYPLNNELTKAAGYAGAGNEISREILSLSVTRNIEYGVFSMIDCFLAGKPEEGLRALSNLLVRESPFGIASLLATSFKQMLAAKKLLNNGKNRSAAVAALGGSSYAAGKAYDGAKRYSEEKLVACIQRFCDVDYLQVTGQAEAGDMLEQALLRAMPG